MGSYRKVAGLAAAAALVVTMAGCSNDADAEFPNDSIELIVPMTAGGSLDTSARAFAAELEKELGQSIQVVNREGASYSIGMNEASSADPDGYTLIMAPGSSFTTVPLLLDTQYKTEDFTAVAPMVDRSYILLTKADSEFESLEDVAELDRRYTYSTFGHGNFTHFAMANFAEQSGTDGEAVPFTSTGDIIQAIQNGQIDFGFIEPNFAGPYLEETGGTGELRALVTSAPERTEYLPDVPTFGELGYETAHDITGRTILATQADVPEDRLERLREAAMKAYESDSYQEYFKTSYGEPPLENIEDFFTTWAPTMAERFEEDMDRLGLQK